MFSKYVLILLWRRGKDLGAGPQPPETMGNFLKNFVVFGKKIAILMPFGSRFIAI